MLSEWGSTTVRDAAWIGRCRQLRRAGKELQGCWDELEDVLIWGQLELKVPWSEGDWRFKRSENAACGAEGNMRLIPGLGGRPCRELLTSAGRSDEVEHRKAIAEASNSTVWLGIKWAHVATNRGVQRSRCEDSSRRYVRRIDADHMQKILCSRASEQVCRDQTPWGKVLTRRDFIMRAESSFWMRGARMLPKFRAGWVKNTAAATHR